MLLHGEDEGSTAPGLHLDVQSVVITLRVLR